MHHFAPILLAISVAGCVTTQSCNGIVSADGTVCALNGGTAASQQQFHNLSDQAARERSALVDYLGNDFETITVMVRSKCVTRHKPPATILIPVNQIEKGTAITAHDITHLRTQGWASRVLKEGLAVYTQYRFGEQQG